jgi:hypothetical protein
MISAGARSPKSGLSYSSLTRGFVPGRLPAASALPRSQSSRASRWGLASVSGWPRSSARRSGATVLTPWYAPAMSSYDMPARSSRFS